MHTIQSIHRKYLCAYGECAKRKKDAESICTIRKIRRKFLWAYEEWAKRKEKTYNRADIGEFLIKTKISSKIIFKDRIKWAKTISRYFTLKHHLTLLSLSRESDTRFSTSVFLTNHFSLAGEYPSGSIKGTQAWEIFGLWFWNLYFFEVSYA